MVDADSDFAAPQAGPGDRIVSDRGAPAVEGAGPAGRLTHRDVHVNGLRLHIAEQGRGPLVILLHGWPESWYSWRHQFAPLAAAGYRVVAVDQRGYARSEQPSDVSAYTLLHLVGDVVALIHELGEDTAVVVGHDWGAPVAWITALLRSDIIRGVAGLSVPPVLPAGMPSVRRSRGLFGDGYYQNYFQEPGIADAELVVDIQDSFRRILFGFSGDNPSNERPHPWIVPDGVSLLDSVPEPEVLPAWLTAEEIDAYAEDYALHGQRAFTGGLNWYRNIDRNNELLAAFRGAAIEVPALYVVGDRDMVTSLRRADERLHSSLSRTLPRLHRVVTLPGCGHWTQQERPHDVNTALLDFLAHVETTTQRGA
ncbi:alpha/beta hydrolase [Streptomyces sp. NPDC052036]|uniref:alpha/beta fold hydrolase n=1 Tax=Streptomyces sp. NPDC052036 TaxID=3155171 RepID=UPI00343B4808